MIDLVHDVAEAYRELVLANSYPGDVVNLEEYVKHNQIETELSRTLLLLAFMLLDAEVTFCVIDDADKEITHLIKRMTYSKEEAMEKADFIFIRRTASIKEKQEAFKTVKVGTLIDPHLSATIICEVEALSEGDSYRLLGPGIDGVKQVQIQGFEDWNLIRAEKNKEFPLGIEIYLVDAKEQLMALPRTTTVTQGGK